MRSAKDRKAGVKAVSSGPSQTQVAFDKSYRIPEDVVADWPRFTGETQHFDRFHYEQIVTAWRNSARSFAGQVRVLGGRPGDRLDRGDVAASIAKRIKDALVPVFNGEAPISGHCVLIDDGKGTVELHWDGKRAAPFASSRESETPEMVAGSYTGIGVNVDSSDALGRPPFNSSSIQVGCSGITSPRSASEDEHVARSTCDIGLTLFDDSVQTPSMDRMDAPGLARHREQLGGVDVSTTELVGSMLPPLDEWTTMVHVTLAPVLGAHTRTQHAADPSQVGVLGTELSPSADSIIARVNRVWEWLRDIAAAYPEAAPAIRDGSRKLSTVLGEAPPKVAAGAEADASEQGRTGRRRAMACGEPPMSREEVESEAIPRGESRLGTAQPMVNLGQFLSVEQAALELGKSIRTVRYHCERGTLPAQRIGERSWAIPREAVEQLGRRMQTGDIRRGRPHK